jgi:hypothetical protein
VEVLLRLLDKLPHRLIRLKRPFPNHHDPPIPQGKINRLGRLLDARDNRPLDQRLDEDLAQLLIREHPLRE